MTYLDDIAGSLAWCQQWRFLDESMTLEEAAAHPLVAALAKGETVTMSFSDMEPDGDDQTFRWPQLRQQLLEERVIGNGSPYLDDRVLAGKLEQEEDEARRKTAGLPLRQELLAEYERLSVGPRFPSAAAPPRPFEGR